MSQLYFGRHEFYGDYRENKPKMHITKQEIARPFSRYRGSLVGLCGYDRQNTLGDLRIVKTKPKNADLCSRCLAQKEALSA